MESEYKQLKRKLLKIEAILIQQLEIKMEELKEQYDMKIIPVPVIKISWVVTAVNAKVKWWSQREKVDHRRCHTNPFGITRCEIVMAGQVYSEFGREEFMGVFLHEYAHLICIEKYGLNGHCLTFKKVCSEIGGTMNSYLAGERFASAASENFLR